ncbi:MAG: DUF202 domain-containing protein [Oscillatoriales cyanobacterium RM2_1_1]|nr:DUF202 domain-containing protein [Oscillatoriales cyanobacterium SM2_3_0]NJO47113.1 DUF202 domain-containing protein [Oscillatoriales cyanobacterium RM2_1_1]
MNANISPKPTNITTELAKERNRAASERTLTAWIQNCIVIIGFGFGFDQIYAAVNVAFPKTIAKSDLFFARSLGMTIVFLGVVLLIMAIIEYPLRLRSINRDHYIYRPAYPYSGLIIAGIVIFGLIAQVIVFVNAYDLFSK